MIHQYKYDAATNTYDYNIEWDGKENVSAPTRKPRKKSSREKIAFEEGKVDENLSGNINGKTQQKWCDLLKHVIIKKVKGRYYVLLGTENQSECERR
jgi:hypothetical protein